MPSIERTIPTIRKRVEEFGNQLALSETRTKYALIDPILHAMGWNLEDPSQVTFEITVPIGNNRTKRGDYALINQDRRNSLIAIEAKKLSASSILTRENVRQLRQYVRGLERMGYVLYSGVLTDGNQWYLYDLQTTLSVTLQPPYSTEVMADTASECASTLRVLTKK